MDEAPPTDYGFDFYRGGLLSGPRSYFPPYHMEHLADGPEGEYLMDREADEAIAWLDQHTQANPDEPFFLYLPTYGVHGPWQAKASIIESYQQQLDPTGAQRNPIYAAMMHSLSQQIGRVIDHLDRNGLLENTIVVVTSDNGGLTEMNGWGLGRKGQFHNGTHITSNEPLRGGKGDIYEGGIRVPTLVLWPGIEGGRTIDTPVIMHDWYPTLLAAAGAARPEHPIDGHDLTPLLKDGRAPEREALIWHFPHYQINASPMPSNPDWRNRPASVLLWLANDLKLVYRYDRQSELFNLKNDPAEYANLIDHPVMKEHILKLSDRLVQGLHDMNAQFPLRNTLFVPTE
jgi:arylsulfatase A-like enzyme